VFLARLKLAQGDVAGAAAILAQADQVVRQHILTSPSSQSLIEPLSQREL
jgi:hypothetical protein